MSIFSIAVKYQNVCQNVEAKRIVQREFYVMKVTAQTFVRKKRIVHRRKAVLQFVKKIYVTTLKLDVKNTHIVPKVKPGLLLG